MVYFKMIFLSIINRLICLIIISVLKKIPANLSPEISPRDLPKKTLENSPGDFTR